MISNIMGIDSRDFVASVAITMSHRRSAIAWALTVGSEDGRLRELEPLLWLAKAITGTQEAR